jgi:uncharacterized repeat protein (TIGR01451 family)/LPXTG-motif cell wall-anchored protein
VTIADPLPGLSALDCDSAVPATLAPGAQLTCTATYTATEADIVAGGVTNVASTSGTPPAGPPVGGDTPPVKVAASAVPSLTIVKSSTDTGFGVGDVVHFTFVVTNSGNVTIVGIEVQDPRLDAPAACAVTELAPGQSTTCTGTHTATQADIDAGSVTNTATALGHPPSGPPITSPPSSVTVDAEPADPGLTVDKQADRTTFTRVGEIIGFSFLVTNTGNVTMHGIAVDDALLDAPAACPVTTLAPGLSTTCTGRRAITAAEVAAGALVNTAKAVGTTPRGTPVVSGVDTVRVAYQGQVAAGSVAPGNRPTGTLGVAAGRLPATGADVQTPTLAGLLLIGVGVVLRRRASLRRPS